jgi:3-methyladenine DNA glycosylase AlkC
MRTDKDVEYRELKVSCCRLRIISSISLDVKDSEPYVVIVEHYITGYSMYSYESIVTNHLNTTLL